MDRRTATVINVGILALTIVVVAVILVVGRSGTTTSVPPDLAIGSPSPQTFVADRSTGSIEDVAATEEVRTSAEDEVDDVFSENNSATLAVLDDIDAFYQDLKVGAFDEPLPTTTTTTEAPTTTTTQPGDESTTTSSTSSTTTEPPTTTTTTLPRKDIEQQIVELLVLHPVPENTARTFVDLWNNDIDRQVEGEPSAFPEIEEKTTAQASAELSRGIKPEELQDRKSVYQNPLTQPAIFIQSLPEDERDEARTGISQLIATFLQANLTFDDDATQAARDLARASVAPVTTIYVFGETIAEQGDELTQMQVVAITDLALYQPEVETGPSRLAMALVGTIAVLLAAFFLWRIAPAQWTRPRHFALLSTLLVLSALISRLPDLIATENHALGYLMPALMIGFMAAILFDPRTAVLMAIPMAGFTAISTGDLAFTLYAAIATVIPVAFVSSVASRRQLRLAVLASAAALAPVAFSLEWLFGPAEVPTDALQAAALAAVGGLVAGFIAMGLVSFLETVSGVTTSLSLLDLLDRNHPALRLLEDKAPGTFNHSMLVGSLAGRAARAIDADPLLAQAAAWYHDLGKTEHPQYFVENQFGVSNPHDELPPAQSAEIIRSHVTDGMRLSKQYRIPPGVADGIRMHHGTSLMRYFYNEAYAADPTVDPELFRHHGVEPRQKEMAIVMLSDAVEAAARAYAQGEDPSAEGLVRLVDSVAQEKVDDHQLAYSDLTFGDLTHVKAELVRALMGYYHTRVPYPGFPGPQPQRGLPAGPASLPQGDGSEVEVPIGDGLGPEPEPGGGDADGEGSAEDRAVVEAAE